MAFTEYRFDPESIKKLVSVRAASLQENRGTSDVLGFGLGVIADRLKHDPRRYLDYGMYWWALKDALRAGGYDYGEQSDPIAKEVYRGESDTETLIMADEFRTEYLRTNIIYSNQFMLDENSAEFYAVFDQDMEERK